MITVTGLNHAVLFVRDLDRSVAFYHDVLGLDEIARERSMMAFLRSPKSERHHDLGLAAVGPNAPNPPPGSVGLYHLAWEVDDIRDLARILDALRARGALTGASDHGATKSVYGTDPDGNEFEVMWPVPRERWGEFENQAPTGPLNLEAEIARFGAKN